MNTRDNRDHAAEDPSPSSSQAIKLEPVSSSAPLNASKEEASDESEKI
jgi:hypothetical protein